MKILFLSGSGDGAWFVWLLGQKHDVSWVIGKDKYAEALSGLIPPPISKVSAPSDFELVVCDTTGFGKDVDQVRDTVPVIGSSEFADTIEHDRIKGIEYMEHCGIKVPPWQPFDNTSKAIDWLRKTHKRTVLKQMGAREDSALTYVSKNSEDMERYIKLRASKLGEFVLQEFVSGTEVSTEGWFDGEKFWAINHDLEEKKFMAGGIGPNTGCSGNVLWMPSRPTPIFAQGLAKTTESLQRIGYVGPLDLNAIVTDGEIFGLEWTPRFGYEGTCNLTRLIPIEFGEFLYKVATHTMVELGEAKHRFAATIRLTVPPYPNPSNPDKYAGSPVDGIDLDKLDAFYLSDVRLVDGKLETIGTDGIIGCPIGCSDSLRGAFDEVEAAISNLMIPNLMYRNDVAKCCESRYNELERLGWLRPLG